MSFADVIISAPSESLDRRLEYTLRIFENPRDSKSSANLSIPGTVF